MMRSSECYPFTHREAHMFKADWLLPLPAGLDQHQAMCNGTAGLTAVSLLAALGY